MTPYDDIKNVGQELVEFSRETEPTTGDLVSRLFPYIWEASRTMSTRQISAWLHTAHNISVSQATVSRALRRQDEYWQELAERVEPAARIVCETQQFSFTDLLRHDRLFEELRQEPRPPFEPEDDDYEEMVHRENAFDLLEDQWFALSRAARVNCYRYLTEGDDESGEK